MNINPQNPMYGTNYFRNYAYNSNNPPMGPDEGADGDN